MNESERVDQAQRQALEDWLRIYGLGPVNQRLTDGLAAYAAAKALPEDGDKSQPAMTKREQALHHAFCLHTYGGELMSGDIIMMLAREAVSARLAGAKQHQPTQTD